MVNTKIVVPCDTQSLVFREKSMYALDHLEKSNNATCGFYICFCFHLYSLSRWLFPLSGLRKCFNSITDKKMPRSFTQTILKLKQLDKWNKNSYQQRLRIIILNSFHFNFLILDDSSFIQVWTLMLGNLSAI